MYKLRFIIIMFSIVVLYQNVCLINNYAIYLNMFLLIAVWLLGTRNIKKDTVQKKVIIYGFGLLWWGTIFIITKYLKITSKITLYFCVGKDFWIYSILPLFIISKIFSINKIKEKLDENPKFLIIFPIVMFIVGYLITNYFYNILTAIDINNKFSYIELIFNHLNILIFVIQLFNALKIKIENKLFTLVSMLTTVVIVLIVNIIPIIKINDISNTLKKYNDVVNSNTLTYKNIANELEPYINDVTNEDTINNNTIFDYQSYEEMKNTIILVGTQGIENVNRATFKKYIDSLQSVSYLIEDQMIPLAELMCNNRIVVIISSIILITGIGIVVSIDKKSFV